jgi:hypothetical protein
MYNKFEMPCKVGAVSTVHSHARTQSTISRPSKYTAHPIINRVALEAMLQNEKQDDIPVTRPHHIHWPRKLQFVNQVCYFDKSEMPCEVGAFYVANAFVRTQPTILRPSKYTTHPITNRVAMEVEEDPMEIDDPMDVDLDDPMDVDLDDPMDIDLDDPMDIDLDDPMDIDLDDPMDIDLDDPMDIDVNDPMDIDVDDQLA